LEDEEKSNKKKEREAYKKKKIDKSNTSRKIRVSLQCVYGIWTATEGTLRRTP
jgi:hypothetical protein